MGSSDPIRQRREDILPLFERELRVCYGKPIRQVLEQYRKELEEEELQNKETVVQPETESSLDLSEFRFPAANDPKQQEAFAQVVKEMGTYTGMTQTEIASFFGISRISLWRKIGKT